ncbi:MAG: AmmeMemoRadiSam system protein B, partial [Desulfovibrionaceae bacterium]|nr:AmmeMemoRadiSam system protein B [Desulfovibrionaceae bacterium]
DFAHRFEHSIEFALLFLQHLLPRGSFRIVPVLCGSPKLALAHYSRRCFQDAAGPFLDTLRAAIRPGGETLVLASVDFCHIGPKFGHMEEAEQLQRDALLHDAALLTALVTGDSVAFWNESRTCKDRLNVCGFSALAALLEILPPCAGTVLGHEISRDDVSASAVSFAAAVFR